jgi:hypothetical protein
MTVGHDGEAPPDAAISAESTPPESGEAPPKKTVGKPFPKGVSGNPSGRPRATEEYKDAMTRLDEKAIEGLEQILDNPHHKKFADVCMYVVNRNHGKPPERMHLSGPNDGPITTATSVIGMDSEQQAKRLAELEVKMAAAAGGPKPGVEPAS